MGSIPGWKDPLEKKMTTHSSNLAWKIPQTEEPGRLQSMRSQSRMQLHAHVQWVNPVCGIYFYIIQMVQSFH